MDLTATYESQDEIPETINFRELFTEKNGKWELTGIAGVKTEADVARVQTSLHKAQNDNKELKSQLKSWEGWDREEVQTKLDRIEELEAAAADKLDDAKIDELAQKRADGIVRTKVAPLERQIKELTGQVGELSDVNGKLTAAADTRAREDVLRPMLVERKVLPEHHEDVFLYAERHFEKGEDGKWFTREGIGGVTAGAAPKDWLEEMLEKRPGWLPPSAGGGARGSSAAGGAFGGQNPWTAEHWNMTEQGRILKTMGRERAEAMAKAAGTKLGGKKPAAKKVATG